VAKYHGVTSTTAKVIGTNILNQFLPLSFEKNCNGNPHPRWGCIYCTSKTWSFSSACKNFGGAAPFRGQNMVFQKSWFGLVWFHHWISVIGEPKFTRLLSSNAKKIVVQNVLVWFWISSSGPKILTIELWSHPKLGQILHVFGP